MANADKRYGFKPAYTLHGGPPSLKRCYTSGAAAIYIGDVVKKSAGNQIAACAADTDIPYGVSATFTESTSESTEVYVYDDLINTVFQAQCNDGTIAGDSLCNLFYDLSIGSASTASESSEMEVATDGSTQDTILVIDKVDRPDNAWGTNVDVYCQIRVHANADAATHTAS